MVWLIAQLIIRKHTHTHTYWDICVITEDDPNGTIHPESEPVTAALGKLLKESVVQMVKKVSYCYRTENNPHLSQGFSAVMYLKINSWFPLVKSYSVLLMGFKRRAAESWISGGRRAPLLMLHLCLSLCWAWVMSALLTSERLSASAGLWELLTPRPAPDQ